MLTVKLTGVEEGHILLELGGLWNSCGYPVASGRCFMEDMKREVDVDPELPLGVRNMFVLTLCRGFFKAHRRWPLLCFGAEAPIYIRKAYKAGTWHEGGGWESKDFKDVFLAKNKDFNTFLDPADLLSDKAISGGR